MRAGLRVPPARTSLTIALAAPAAIAAAALVGVAAVFDPALLVGDIPLVVLAICTQAAVGGALAIRVPANAIGWLLLVSASLLGVEFLALFYAEASDRFAAGSWPGTVMATWLYSNLLGLPVLIVAIVIPLIYPDGRLISPRWRWILALLALMILSEILKWFRPGAIPDTDVPNPFAIGGVEPLLQLFSSPLLQPAAVAVFASPIAAVVIRYRRGTTLERAQLRWLIGASVLTVTAWAVVAVSSAVGATTITTLGWLAGLLAFSGLPIAIGIAVLRYRLYEIDRIISRTIAWAVVTGVLVTVLAVGVFGLQAALAGVTQGGTLAVAVSTLVAAALFQPLLSRVQRAVDRRFDRTRYDTQRTVEAFAERLRNEVTLEAVVADIAATAAASVRPASLSIWLRAMQL